MCYMKEILRSNRIWVIIYLAIGLLNAFTANYKADYFQKIVDGLTNNTITIYGILLYGGVLIFHYGMNYLDEYPASRLGNGIYMDFKLLALQKMGRVDYSEYQKLGTGKLIQQIENGANAGKGILYDFWFCVVRNLLPTILFSLFFIWKIDRNITYFLLAGYVVVFAVTNLLLKGLYQIKEKILTNEEQFNHFLVRGFMEMTVFRIRRQFSNEVKRASNAKQIIVTSKVKMTMIHEAFFTIFALLVAVLDIGILIYAWKNSHLSVGAVVALITLIDNAYTPIAIFNVVYIQYKLNKTAWLRFVKILDLKEDMQLYKGSAFSTFLNEIRVDNLSYSYGSVLDKDKKILNRVNLVIRKGEKVAFVGESGSGKSTLVKLLIGLLKYKSGDILVDNQSLKNFSLDSFYKKVSYLSQDTPVFDGTIRENLVLGKTVSDAAVHASLEGAQLLSLIASMDNGIDTRIGEKGTCLSGGEKQRLALARLWFDCAEIVVLDEATSALDSVTESIVMKNVLMQIHGATVIAIVHRLASVSDFDQIFVFKEGKVIGSGTFEELLATNSYFKELYEKEKRGCLCWEELKRQ